MAKTLAQELEGTAAQYPERAAVVTGDERLSWSDVRDRSVELARLFASLGVGRGDRIGLWLPNEASWGIGWCAASYVGAAVIPVNTRLKASEIRYVLKQSEMKLLLMRSGFIGIDLGNILAEALEQGEEAELAHLENVILTDEERPETGRYLPAMIDEVTMSAEDVVAASEEISPDDDLIIVYTSGTTGNPKGAVHSSTTALGQMARVNDWLQVGPDSTLLAQLPFFHIGGSFTGIASAVICGARLLPMERWNVEAALDLVEAERVTHLMGMPTHYLDLLEAQKARPRDIESLSVGWIGGASIPAEIVERSIGELGLQGLTCTYGMTESPAVTFSAIGDPPETVHAGKVRPISDAYEVKVVDPATDQPCPAGTEGEIRMKGEPVMLGYFRMPEATADATDSNGFFKSGDLGKFDQDGYLSITGRIKDMFIVGGMNTYPAEIEATLSHLPEVRLASVVGVPDRRLGEVGFAFVELETGATPDRERILEYCKKNLAGFKVPRHIHFISEWPVTPTGKIQKFHLRDMAEQFAKETSEAGK